MDIKNIVIIAFVATLCANCCADVAKLKTVTIVTNLVYDAWSEHHQSCVSAPNSHKNRYSYWNTCVVGHRSSPSVPYGNSRSVV